MHQPIILYIVFRSDCNTTQYSTSDTLLYRRLSSAKLISLEFAMPLSISDIEIKNNSGPSTVPSGTPLITWLSVLEPPGLSNKLGTINKEMVKPFAKFTGNAHVFHVM